jgi:hypothetical protein
MQERRFTIKRNKQDERVKGITRQRSSRCIINNIIYRHELSFFSFAFPAASSLERLTRRVCGIDFVFFTILPARLSDVGVSDGSGKKKKKERFFFLLLGNCEYQTRRQTEFRLVACRSLPPKGVTYYTR